jgi:hypothetical protein
VVELILGLGEDFDLLNVSWSGVFCSCIECWIQNTWIALNEVVGGIYSSQPLPSHWQSLLVMGTPDSPLAHRTVIVQCPVRATSARPLGFGVVDCWSRLPFCCTGQSRDLWLLRSDFYRGTVHHCSSEQSTVGVQGACWGLVLKCYELRTRQHKMLNIKALRPSKHYFPLDIMNLRTKVTSIILRRFHLRS